MQEPDDIVHTLNVDLTAADLAILRNGQVPLAILRNIPVTPAPGTRLRFKNPGTKDRYVVMDKDKSHLYLSNYALDITSEGSILLYNLTDNYITWIRNTDLHTMELDTPF